MSFEGVRFSIRLSPAASAAAITVRWPALLEPGTASSPDSFPGSTRLAARKGGKGAGPAGISGVSVASNTQRAKVSRGSGS